MTRYRSALAVLALGSLLALGACSAAEESVRDDTGAISEANDNASVFDMKVGDCYRDPGMSDEVEEFETLPAVPCAEEHEFEVYAVDTLAEGTFPGDDAVVDLTDDLCHAGFEPFVGTAYDDSELDYTYLFPTQESWAGGDRDIVCLVGALDGPNTGTLKNARR